MEPALPTDLSRDELLDLLPDGVVVADRDGVVTHVNEAARRLLRPAQEPVGRGLGEVLPLQDLDGRGWFACTTPYTGLRIRRLQAESSWHLPDGTELLLTARMHRRGPDAPVEHVVVSLRSARARTRLDRERSDLVATVAHELRSPLTGVRGFTASLLERWDKFNDEQKRLIMETVHADTDRLTRLIAELLEVARIDTGRLTLHPRPTDAAHVVAQVSRSVKAGTGREVSCQAEGDLPQIWADPDRLVQVVTNLVENALLHGDGAVHVSMENAGKVQGDRETPDGPPEMVRLVVQDEGAGISPEIRRRVFTKFWKYGARGGSGLGLYIVHGLVTAHGGTITIGDADGGGARIEVLWPVTAPGHGPGASAGPAAS